MPPAQQEKNTETQAGEQPQVHPRDQENSDERAEFEALGRIAHAMRNYKGPAWLELERWDRNYERLSDLHRQILVDTIPQKLEAASQAVHQNQIFFNYLLSWMSPENAPPPLSEANEAADAWQQGHGGLVTPGDFEKMLYVVKNLARDWSQEFESERKESYGLICDSLVEIFEGQLAAAAKPGSRAVPPRVLVPGCGLARLCVDLVQRGFDAIGNEHSYFMLLTSAYILNGTGREKQWTVFPWVLQQSNNWSTKDQLQSVQIPDMCPADMVGNSLGSLGMIAGDFIEVFTSPEYHGEFDAVATCFFIDTAHNVIEYMEILWDILKPGGVWINLGPLQWHWADSHTYLPEEELSLELPLDSVIEIAKHIGFEIELDVQKESKLYCRYMSNPDSMRPQGYDCAFWVARKPKAPTP